MFYVLYHFIYTNTYTYTKRKVSEAHSTLRFTAIASMEWDEGEAKPLSLPENEFSYFSFCWPRAQVYFIYIHIYCEDLLYLYRIFFLCLTEHARTCCRRVYCIVYKWAIAIAVATMHGFMAAFTGKEKQQYTQNPFCLYLHLMEFHSSFPAPYTLPFT